MRGRVFAGVCSLILAQAALAAPPDSVCGTDREGWRAQTHLHKLSGEQEYARLALRGLMYGTPPPSDFDSGGVAVIEGTAGVFTGGSRFDLAGKTLRMERLSPGYRVHILDGGYRPEDAASGTPLTGLGDDEARSVDLPFAFAFYGGRHRQVWVHSDGTLTFEQPDAQPGERSLGRLVTGPPRIAPQFNDLDPSQAPGSVRVLVKPGAVTVSWVDVPEFRSFGAGPQQTFQVRLYADGSIEMSWDRVRANSMVVGMAPGRGASETQVVDLGESGGLRFDNTLAEPFDLDNRMDQMRVAQRFYESHDDAYDYLVIFNTAGLRPAPTALASATPVRSLRWGLGDVPVDTGIYYGSQYRLQAVLDMGPLSQYPIDPLAPVGNRGLITGDNTMTLLSHETGHLFLALASVRDPNDPFARPMLGQGFVHWSFNYNSDASFLEGNRIADLGNGANPRFATTATVERYSALDQYLMGLRAPSEVPPGFVVYPGSQPAIRLPQRGVPISGTRRDVTIEEIVAAEGQRIPDHTIAQRRFRFAFLLVTREGEHATPEQIAQIERYRQDFETYFHQSTDGRGVADTALRKSLKLSAWPATGVVAGETALVSVEVERPAEEDLTIALKTTGGFVRAPERVTIRQGQSRVRFPMKGLTAGVADLTAEAERAGYESVHARVQVFESKSALRLIVHYAAGPIVLRVAAGTEVNVSNVPIRVSAPGIIEFVEDHNTSLVTLEDGLMWLWWTPPESGPAELVAEIEGRPETRVVISAPPR